MLKKARRVMNKQKLRHVKKVKIIHDKLLSADT